MDRTLDCAAFVGLDWADEEHAFSILVGVWLPDDENTRSLRLLSEQRRAWVEQRVGLENELRQRLKDSYPLALNNAIAECDQQIAERFAQHPDQDLFTSFPGAGQALAPRLAAAFGTNRDKFPASQDLQQISGIAPITRRSGKTRVVLVRRACPKFLRQTFHEFARCSTRFSTWAQAYLKMRTAAGDRYHVILRSLAFKWQRILFRCWKNRQAYDEQRCLQRLRVTGSNLIPFLPSSGAPTP